MVAAFLGMEEWSSARATNYSTRPSAPISPISISLSSQLHGHFEFSLM